MIRRENGVLKQYVHLATGNYNPSTARIYCDLSLFTADPQIASDATRFFHHITGFAKNTPMQVLAMSPTQIKPKILKLIDGEIKKGSEGEIIAKMNSLVDGTVISALYKASKAGVKVSLIVRGICCLRPGIPGVSDNIRVISLVGKYLEHARLFYFKHAEPTIYFSSADWMPRNLSKRIELLTPVKDPEIANGMYQLLLLQLSDNVQARELGSDGEYTKVENDLPSTDSHKILEDHVSKLNDSVIHERHTTGKSLGKYQSLVKVSQ